MLSSRNPAGALRVWRDGELVFQAQLTTTAPLTTCVRVPDGEKRVVLETQVGCVTSPRDLGITDDPELGMRVTYLRPRRSAKRHLQNPVLPFLWL
jgi:hypothetical protein